MATGIQWTERSVDRQSRSFIQAKVGGRARFPENVINDSRPGGRNVRRMRCTRFALWHGRQIVKFPPPTHLLQKLFSGGHPTTARKRRQIHQGTLTVSSAFQPAFKPGLQRWRKLLRALGADDQEIRLHRIVCGQGRQVRIAQEVRTPPMKLQLHLLPKLPDQVITRHHRPGARRVSFVEHDHGAHILKIRRISFCHDSIH
jgi:hypothetical protein